MALGNSPNRCPGPASQAEQFHALLGWHASCCRATPMRTNGLLALALLVAPGLVACAGEPPEVVRPWGGVADGGDELGGSEEGSGTFGGTFGGDDGDATIGSAGDDGPGGDDRPGADEAGDDAPPPPSDDGGDDGPPPAQCPANCYCERFDASADVSDLQQSFDGSNWAEVMIGVLDRRYPAAADLLVEMEDDPYFGAFTDTSSFTSLMDSVMTEVHEGTHGWDYDHALGQPYFGYWLRSDLVYEPPKIDGFPRSEIHSMLVDDSTALYADTYLTGEQGTYGFYELLDEMNAYINGMGAIAAVGEHIPWGVSGRDGAVAFLYYLELYLRRARTAYPDLYAELRAEPEYVELVQTQWLRTHFLLERADAFPELGIHDQEIRANLYAPENQAELEMFIGRPLQAGSCLP